MAAINVNAWIPEEYTSAVIQRINQTSVVESMARQEPMGTDTRRVPRSGGAKVGPIAKSQAYPEDDTPNDDVVLTARKMGQAFRIADEDLGDSLVNVLSTKQSDWATSYGKFFDNATLATTGAENGTTVLFSSVYNELNTTQTINGELYTAGDNINAHTFIGDSTDYDALSDFLALVEEGDYWDGDLLVVAHPAFRSVLRKIKDDNGDPTFVQGREGTPDTLFGYQLRWSRGNRTSATNTANPTGNPLLTAVNRDLLIKGNRSGPESMFIDGRTGVGALTDESILKMRARRGFKLGHPRGAAILEKTTV
jgi:HK97 family phage major capsid protein